MDGTRVAPLCGIAGCLAVVVTLFVPYLAIDAGAVGIYYGTGSINPLVGGLFSAVTIIVLAAGYSDRTNPATAAGVALVFGLLVAGISLVWAITVPEAVVFQLSTATILGVHRWVLVVVSLVIPASGLWYARVLGLLQA